MMFGDHPRNFCGHPMKLGGHPMKLSGHPGKLLGHRLKYKFWWFPLNFCEVVHEVLWKLWSLVVSLRSMVTTP